MLYRPTPKRKDPKHKNANQRHEHEKCPATSPSCFCENGPKGYDDEKEERSDGYNTPNEKLLFRGGRSNGRANEVWTLGNNRRVGQNFRHFHFVDGMMGSGLNRLAVGR